MHSQVAQPVKDLAAGQALTLQVEALRFLVEYLHSFPLLLCLQNGVSVFALTLTHLHLACRLINVSLRSLMLWFCQGSVFRRTAVCRGLLWLAKHDSSRVGFVFGEVFRPTDSLRDVHMKACSILLEVDYLRLNVRQAGNHILLQLLVACCALLDHESLQLRKQVLINRHLSWQILEQVIKNFLAVRTRCGHLACCAEIVTLIRRNSIRLENLLHIHYLLKYLPWGQVYARVDFALSKLVTSGRLWSCNLFCQKSIWWVCILCDIARWCAVQAVFCLDVVS